MNETHTYAVTVRWTSEKRGVAEATSLPSLEVATPPEFGGHEGIWSPEHLFVTSLASCLMSTFLAIAGNSKLGFSGLESVAEGSVVRGQDGRYWIAGVTLRPRLTLENESDRERATRIMEKAGRACLISNSVRSAIRVDPVIAISSRSHGAPPARI